MLRFQIAHAPAGEPAEIGRRRRQAESHVYRQHESARASAPEQGYRGKHPVFAGLQQKLPEQEKRERVDKDSKDLKRDRAVDSRQLGQLDKSNLNRIPEQVMWIQVLGAEKVESLQAVDIPVIIEKRRTQRQV